MDLQKWLLREEEMESVIDSQASEILMLWFKNVGAFFLCRLQERKTHLKQTILSGNLFKECFKGNFFFSSKS